MRLQRLLLLLGFGCALLGGACLGCSNESKMAPKTKAPKTTGRGLEFKIESTPNNELALFNDEWSVRKQEPVELLSQPKAWKVRFSSLPNTVDPSTVKWYIKKTGADFELFSDQDPSAENVMGSNGQYEVKMEAKKDTMPVTGVRTLVVSEIISEGFGFTVQGAYLKNSDPKHPFYVKRPSTAIYLGATAKVKKDCPSLAKGNWKHGFIQSVDSASHEVKYHALAAPPKYKYVQSFTTRVNDAPLGQPPENPRPKYKLYGISTAEYIENYAKVSDTPGPPQFSTGTYGGLLYELVTPVKIEDNFTVWHVLICYETDDCIPLVQQSWKLAVDSKDAGPWYAQALGKPAAPAVRPTDASTSSVKYGPLLDGP